MSKRKKPKNQKLKQSLTHSIRKVFSENKGTSLNHKQVCALIDVKEASLRKLTYSILEELAKNNFLKKDGYSSYKINSSHSSFEGVLQLTNRGAGFVIVDDENIADIYIPERSLNHSIGGDIVKVVITKKGTKRFEGEIVELIERERTQFVGTIQMHDKFAFLI